MDVPAPSTSRFHFVGIETTTDPSDFDLELSMSCSSDEEQVSTSRKLNDQEVKGLWNLVKVFRLLGTREQTIAFAEQRGMLPKEKVCHYHKKLMSISYASNQKLGAFLCCKGKCRSKSQIPRAKGTWFENVKITIPQVFYLMYAYAENFNLKTTIKEDFSEGEHCLSTATINQWFNHCRQGVVSYQKYQQERAGKIGGPGKIVQLDKSKFGKTKYNKAQVEGQWIFSLVEDGKKDLRVEVCPDNVCSAKMLVPLIQKHVVEGTTIHTDNWRTYDCLGENGYIHIKVNHNDPENPLDVEDGRHIHRNIKKFLLKSNYNRSVDIESLLLEYLWRKHIEINRKDTFEELIDVINFSFKK